MNVYLIFSGKGTLCYQLFGTTRFWHASWYHKIFCRNNWSVSKISEEILSCSNTLITQVTPDSRSDIDLLSSWNIVFFVVRATIIWEITDIELRYLCNIVSISDLYCRIFISIWYYTNIGTTVWFYVFGGTWYTRINQYYTSVHIYVFQCIIINTIK